MEKELKLKCGIFVVQNTYTRSILSGSFEIIFWFVPSKNQSHVSHFPLKFLPPSLRLKLLHAPLNVGLLIKCAVKKKTSNLKVIPKQTQLFNYLYI